jgi:hypothetical protein
MKGSIMNTITQSQPETQNQPHAVFPPAPPRASTEQDFESPLNRRNSMNAYEQRQAARRERLEAAAQKAETESMNTYRRAKEMADCIPFGQPILIGHHSENRDRRFRDRIHNTFGKSFALQKKAAQLAQKAASVGTGGISSDDPEAIEKLQKELDAAIENQEMMKASNRAIRANRPEAQKAALVALGLAESSAEKILTPGCFGGIGFPAYAFQGNNANMRRIEQRIEELKKRRERADVEETGNGYTYREDVAENRIMFIFSGKPAANIRDLLKHAAFKWSPSRGAWVRQLSNNARWSAADLRRKLDELT